MSLILNHAGGQTKNTGTTLDAALSANVASGNVLILGIVVDFAAPSGPTVTNITKPAGETASWQKVPSTIVGPGGTGANSVVAEVWVIETETEWNSTTFPNITVTLSTTRNAKGVVLQEHDEVTGTIRGSSVVGESATGSPTGTVTSPLDGDLVIGFSAWESAVSPTGDSDTTNGSWSAVNAVSTSGGLDQSNVTAAFQYKYVTADGDQTYNPTGTSNDSGVIVFTLASSAPSVIEKTASDSATISVQDYSSKPDLQTFRDAIANRESSRVNIGMLGCSLVEGYPVTADKTIEQYLAEALRADYPTTDNPDGYGRVPIPTASMGPYSIFTVTPGTGGAVGTSNATSGWGANHQTWLTNGSLAVPPILVATIVDGPWSSFDIDLLRVSGYSTTAGKYRVDGGSWVNFSLSTTGIQNEKLHVNTTVNSTIEITIETGNAGSYVIVNGVTGYRGDENKGIQVHNFGHSGYRVNQWRVSANPTYDFRHDQALEDLDLLIISDLGVNDAQTLTSAQFRTDLEDFLNYLLEIHYDVPIVMVGAYDMTAGVTFVETWDNYIDVLSDVSAKRGIPFIDLTTHMPATPNAIYHTDDTHSNTNGDAYRMMATIIAHELTDMSVDTATISVSEEASVEVTVHISSSDSATISIEESHTDFISIESTDGGTIMVADPVLDLLLKSAREDDATLTLSESASLDILDQRTLTDTGEIDVVESASIFVTLSSTDEATISLVEGTGRFVEIPSSDDIELTVDEQATTDVSLSSTDSGTISAEETQSIEESDERSSSDTATISATEDISIFVELVASDSATISLEESTSGFVTASATDDVDLSVDESYSSELFIDGLDSTFISVDEETSGSNSVSADDDASISVSESTDTLVVISSDDEASISVDESQSQEGVNALSGSDSGDISVVEESSIEVGTGIDSGDVSEISVVETQSVYSTGVASDEAELSVDEESSIDRFSGASDSATVSIDEINHINITDAAVDSAQISVVEESSIVVFRYVESDDSATVSVAESTERTEFNELTSSDEATISVVEDSEMYNSISATDEAEISVTYTIDVDGRPETEEVYIHFDTVTQSGTYFEIELLNGTIIMEGGSEIVRRVE